MRNVQASLVGFFFLVAGVPHFLNPRMYEAIMPPYLPAHRELVYVSGAFELLGGVGVLLPRTRVAAGWGLIALMIAVFPANFYMATDAEKFANVGPTWLFYARLPLQFAVIWWIYNACIKRPA